MRNYWLKIVAGMLGVFAVGMVVVSIARHVRGQVRSVVETNGAITIPLAFVPFRLDGDRLGEIRRIRVIRSAPKQVSGFEVVVDLADSTAASRLEGCAVALDDVEHLNNRSTFRCVREPGDTAGHGLVPFGEIALGSHGGTHVLLIPKRTADEISNRGNPREVADSLRFMADSIRAVVESVMEAAAEQADSIAELESARADSLVERHMLLADSIRTMAERRADSIRAAADRRADSIRRAARPR